MTPFIVVQPFHKAVILNALTDMKFMLDSNITELESEKDYLPGMPEVIQAYKAMLTATDEMLTALYSNNGDNDLNIVHHFPYASMLAKYKLPKARYMNIITYQEPNKLPHDIAGGIYFELATAQAYPGDKDSKYYKSFRTVIFFELETKK